MRILLVTLLVALGLPMTGLPAATPTATASTTPPLYDPCIVRDGIFLDSPGGFGTQCIRENSGGLSVSPRAAVVAWGSLVTATVSPGPGPGNVSWNVSFPIVSGCGLTDSTCTFRFTPGDVANVTGPVPWHFFGVSAGFGQHAYGALWAEPELYQVALDGKAPDGSRAFTRTSAGIAVLDGMNPDIADCDHWGQSYGNGTRGWWPEDGVPPCIFARAINESLGNVAWDYRLPRGTWDLYQFPQNPPYNPTGPARQPTPWSVERVVVGFEAQYADSTLMRRPAPKASVEVVGQQPVKLHDRRTVRVTLDAGPADGGFAEVDFDPADIALTSSNPSIVSIVGGPEPAPSPGGFQMFGGQQRVFTYEVETHAEGTVTLSSTIKSTDDLGIVTQSTGTATLEARVVRQMEFRNLVASPDTATTGNQFTVTGNLVNTGNVDVLAVDVQASLDSSVPGGADLSTPSPATIPTLAAGASVPISVHGTLTDSGATIALEASGSAEDNASSVTARERLRAGQTPTAFTARIVAPDTVEAVTNPDGELEPRDVEVVVEVTNLGEDTLTGVQLAGGDPHLIRDADLTRDPLEAVSGPSTFIGDIEPGQSTQLIFHYRAVATGGVNVQVSVSADGPDGTDTQVFDDRILVSSNVEASIEWEMGERYVTADDAVTTYAEANPESWDFVATIDAPGCATADITLAAKVVGSDEDYVDVATTPQADSPCALTFQRTDLDPFDLRAQLERDGELVAEVVERLEPKDIVIVSVGDSMSSGEGSRDPSEGWTEQQCNRSWLAGPAQAARQVENDGDSETTDDQHSSVTFLHLACSGANTPAGLLGGYAGIDAGLGGALPPQIYAIPAILGKRPVDALLMTAGINDLPFIEFLTACINTLECGTTTIGGEPIGTVIEHRVAALPRQYDRISAALGQIGVSPGSVFLLEYPDPSKDALGDYCTTVIPNGGTILPEEYEFLDAFMQQPLNAAGAAAASAHGWNRVGGVAAAFRTHGLCAANKWSNTVTDSLAAQGNVNGAFHPNPIGHAAFGQIIADAMLPDLWTTAGGGGTGGGSGSSASQVDGPVPAGSNVVPLTNDIFDVGDVVTLNPGHANAETVRIEAKGSLIFDQELRYDHGPGELIVLTSSLPEEVGANDPPVAVDDNVSAVPVGITSVRMLDNDIDPEGLPVHLTGLSAPTGVEPSADNQTLDVNWSLVANRCEPVVFRYRIIDNEVATSQEATVTVTPDCAAPTIALDSTSVDEGATVMLTPTVAGGVGPVTLAWDAGDDGSTDGTGATFAFTAPDGPTTASVKVTATDSVGHSASATSTITVLNVAPTVGALVAPPTVEAGATFSVQATGLADVPADPLLISFDCGGGFGAPSAATSTTCTAPPSTADVTLRVRVDDSDGGVTTATTGVTVVAPPPPPPPPPPPSAGLTLKASASPVRPNTTVRLTASVTGTSPPGLWITLITDITSRRIVGECLNRVTCTTDVRHGASTHTYRADVISLRLVDLFRIVRSSSQVTVTWRR